MQVAHSRSSVCVYPPPCAVLDVGVVLEKEKSRKNRSKHQKYQDPEIKKSKDKRATAVRRKKPIV